MVSMFSANLFRSVFANRKLIRAQCSWDGNVGMGQVEATAHKMAKTSSFLIEFLGSWCHGREVFSWIYFKCLAKEMKANSQITTNIHNPSEKEPAPAFNTCINTSNSEFPKGVSFQKTIQRCPLSQSEILPSYTKWPAWASSHVLSRGHAASAAARCGSSASRLSVRKRPCHCEKRRRRPKGNKTNCTMCEKETWRHPKNLLAG